MASSLVRGRPPDHRSSPRIDPEASLTPGPGERPPPAPLLARGYHGATLEQIADEAGFSKGVVYSQFDSKADLFLTLLRARIEERSADNARVASSRPGGGVAALLEHLAGGGPR